MKQKPIEVEKDETLAAQTIEELNLTPENPEIEVVPGQTKFNKEIEDLEAFMNERLVVVVAEDNREGALACIKLDVGNNSQLVVRGAQTKIKRKYVEALARAYNVSYRPQKVDTNGEIKIKMVPRIMQSYPFVVLRDPNPRGPEWLRRILAEKRL